MRRSFYYLNITQFLDALNENLFKFIVAFFLISTQADESSSDVMSATGAVFVLPFILFSNLGGIFADLHSKTRIIQITRILQCFSMLASFFMILFKVGDWMYLALFITTSLSAIFGPSKYGIIPEIVSKENFVKANSYVAAFTYFGIIIGTALASILASLTHQTFWIMMIACLAVAFLGLITSYQIRYVDAAYPNKKWPKFIYREIFDALIDMKQKPMMLVAVFCYSYFLFIGAYVQMNIIPYSISVLKKGPVMGGYLFLAASIGIAFGSLLVSKMSGKLTSLPYSGLGISLGCFLFTWASNPFWLSIIWVVGVGIAGGMFLVPPQAFILAHSAPENKGRNMGTANFLSFIGALLAALVLFVINSLLAINPDWSFTWVGVITLIVVLYLFIKIYSRKNLVS